MQRVVKPLQQKKEQVYVVSGSDAEDHVIRRFTNKTIRLVGNGLRPQSIQGFLEGLPLVFQRNKATNLNVAYHFTFTGMEKSESTVLIRNKELQIKEGHTGKADLHLIADSQTWLKFLAKEKNIVWALLTRKTRLKGSPKLLLAFGRCFPS